MGIDDARPRGVAIIGSFKQFYSEVLLARDILLAAGLEVASPSGSGIIQPGIDFVRFTSDDVGADDALVQSRTLARILGADLVYVVAPGGYLGRTTCYEIGRVRQASVPLYFSEIPNDLPIRVPAARIVSPVSLIDLVTAGRVSPWEFDDHESDVIERQLAVLRR